LKELHLTEGRGTGVPKIYRVLERNGSPNPVLETDSDCNYFLTVIFAHPDTDSFREPEKENQPIKAKNINSLSDINELLAMLSNQVGNQVSNQVGNQVKNVISEKIGSKAERILFYLSDMPRKSKEILENLLGFSVQTKNRKRYLDPLLAQDWIEQTIKENPKDPNQKYQLTEKGRLVVTILSQSNS
jgi:ATP-dependent DNA helicase RecG